MNHIYKTIFNNNTGQIDVVSENTSNHSRSKNVSSSQTQTSEKEIPKKSLPTMKISYISLLISLIMSAPAIASTDYDGTGSLTDSTTIQGNFDQLLTGQNIEGVFDQNSHEVNIDYSTGTTPDFILAGYSFVTPDDTVQTESASGNTINLKQGNINGSVYAGLVHGSIIEKNDTLGSTNVALKNEINNKTLAANNNNINILNTDPVQISEDISSGYAEININYGNLNAATATDTNATKTATDTNANVYAYAIANAYANNEAYANNANLNANQNTSSINGNSNTLNDISTGYTAINISNGDINAADAQVVILSVYTGVPTRADANAYANNEAYANNANLNSNQNTSSINGNSNTLNDISTGYTAINLSSGDINAAKASAQNSMTSTTAPTISANAYANNEAYANNANLNANQNTSSINGNSNTLNDISTGYAAINISSGDINAAKADASTYTIVNGTEANVDAKAYATNDAKVNNANLSANLNNTSINGDNNTINDISAGYAGMNINYGNLNAADANANANADVNASANADAFAYTIVNAKANGNTLNANQNNTSINGDNNTINDISTGYAEININYGNLNAANADADAQANASTTDADAQAYILAYAELNMLSANENNISINGDNNTINDISIGYVGVNMNYGNTSAGNATTNANKEALAAANAYAIAYSNSLSANQNTSSINGNSNTINDISAGYTAININYGNTSAGNATTTDADAIADAIASAKAYGNSLSANQNTSSITGDNNTINDISAGYAGINIKFGDVIGGTKIINGASTDANVLLSTDLHDSKLYANDNKISLAGSSTISGDLKTGTIDFNIEYGKVETANGDPGVISINTIGTSAYANNNEISIIGAHQFTNPNSVIYGGSLNIANPDYKPESYDVFTGNTLNYNNSVPITIKEIGNFQTYNFTLNPTLANTNTALITAQNITLGTNQSNSSDYLTKPVTSDIYVVGIQSGPLVSTDSEFVLMQADAGQLTGKGTGHSSKGVAQQGISLLYDVETKVDKTKDQVIAVINSSYEPGPTVNPQLKALLEGNLSGLMLLTRGADQLSNNLFSAITEQNQQRGLTPFVIFSGNHSKYDTGSYIKSNGGLFTVGLSIQEDQWLAGAFIENGWDSYKTFNDFANADEVRGKGHNRFNGVGLYGHYDFLNGWYADATVRGGRLHTSFNTDDIRNATTGESAGYDLSHNYYGMNLEGGYKFAWDEKNTLNLNTKYLWATTSAKSMQIADDPIHFDKLTSQRIQLNAENNYQLNSEMSILTGLGFEYEFDGKAKGTTYNIYDIDQASVKGSTGVATVGLRYEPKAYNRFSMDLKGSGYFGKREGGAAMLKMDYTF